MSTAPRSSHLVLLPAARAPQHPAAPSVAVRRYKLARLTVFEGRDQRAAAGQGSAPVSDGRT